MKGPIITFLGAVIGAFVAGVIAWIFLEQHIDAHIESTVADMFKAGKIPLPSPSPGPKGDPGPPADVKALVIHPNVHLLFLNGRSPDSVDDINLIRETERADKVITVRELEGRRIIALSWSPIANIGAMSNFSGVTHRGGV